MQVPIDFGVTILDSGSVIIIILLSSLMIFASQIKDVFADLAVGTRRGLIAYAMAGFAMALASFVSINENLRFLVTGAGAFFLGAIVIAEFWVLFSEERAGQGTIVVSVLIAGTFVNNFLEEFMGFPLYFMMIALVILLVGSVYFAIVLLRENPSTFTASLLVVLLLYMATWVIGITGWTFTNPQYYVVQVIPLIVAATIFSSVRKPWRTTLAVFVMLFTFTISMPLMTTAYYVGNWTIFAFVGIEIITALCLISPLNYFLDQAADTGAKTPLYLGILVALVALLVSTHSLAWSIYISSGLVWDQYIVWIDVLIGSAAIVAFVLAAVSSLYGDWAQTITREVLIIFGTAAAFLTFPLSNTEALGQAIGMTNQDVWLAIGVIIIIGTLMFIRLGYKIAKAGGGTAARNLMMFVISVILIAIVSMYSDQIPPYPPAIPVVVIALLVIADIMSVLSNPNFVTMARKRLRRESSEEPIPESTPHAT